MGHTRIERDSLGEIAVEQSALWGAQTARSLVHFPIVSDTMPLALIHCLAMIKHAAAVVNHRLGVLPEHKMTLICQAADEVISGQHDDQFPLSVWQTGSGTQTNMNVNEVIANRANELAGFDRGSKQPVHPNDDVNRSQSSNDVFPTAMYMAGVLEITTRLLPALDGLQAAFDAHATTYQSLVKIGRTHLQDATPLTFGQEFSGYSAQLAHAKSAIESSLTRLSALTIGGTAVGTGINTPPGYATEMADALAQRTGYDFVSHPNKFAGSSAHDELVIASGALKGLAVALMKIANDIRWLASGPRCGLGELSLPENEPGSSIMPGKVNPTQCEALTMIAVQVMGADAAIGFAGSQGHFELNVYKPVMIYNFLHAVHLLAEGMSSFTKHCIAGLEVNREKIQHYLDHSLMLITALTPVLGYDQCAHIAHTALKEGITLKEACVRLELMDAQAFDQAVQPQTMVGSVNRD